MSVADSIAIGLYAQACFEKKYEPAVCEFCVAKLAAGTPGHFVRETTMGFANHSCGSARWSFRMVILLAISFPVMASLVRIAPKRALPVPEEDAPKALPKRHRGASAERGMRLNVKPPYGSTPSLNTAYAKLPLAFAAIHLWSTHPLPDTAQLVAAAVQAALRAGIEGILFTGRLDVAERLVDIAGERGVRLLTERPLPALDLAAFFFASPESLRQRCAEILATPPAFC